MTSNDRSNGLRSEEKVRIVLIFAFIGVAIALGVSASAIIARTSTILAGLAVVAFTFGLRHGVDADHIAAIDNVTRRLIHEGKKPVTIGTWFSLGHSTVVLLMIVALTVATKKVVESLPVIQKVGAVLGTAVSGAFLWLIGLMNLIVAISLYRAFRDLKAKKASPVADNAETGFMFRYFKSLFRTINKPWKMYIVGVLFGIGFDTASEVALIAISVGVGVSGSLPIWMVLLLPFMFACGMVLVDTADGVAMRFAYGWALLSPLRKTYYNFTITVISVLVALLIGTVELVQVATLELNLHGTPWSYLGTINFETLGFFTVAVFAMAWFVSLANWRLRMYDKQLLGLTQG